ncbi:DUF6279 family lipoprotein [Pseudomonas sp. GD03944]|uniref:DUF6279 family lipoprotein n=1 Tax=Pseudomonas sp. GD03944 TaxID=2975409 RepID=UPI00244A496B|nr:DUF6279 family lipoprotein [Pseudomonas sp. GD03944]MDH1261942.1 DUF6279 family lipoprotein [Pseudomonas sp. GD03944]
MKRPLLLLLILSLLSACSSVGLAYRNLDWLIPWRLNDYLTLTSEQKAWLKPRIQAHLAWHCSTELPHTLGLLEHARTLLAQPEGASPEQFGEQLAEFDAAVKRIAVQITPTAIELLQGLNPKQVAELQAAIDEDNQEDRQDFLEPELAVQITERAERMEERLRPWFGRLSEAQQARILQWSTGLGEQNRIWLENRQQWQQAFSQTLDARKGADFSERMTRLLQDREAFYTDAYRAAYPKTRAALATLFSDLLGSADAKQRERLDHRLRDLHRDLAAQACSTG